MLRLQSMFLRGPAGWALVLLRVSVTVTLIDEAGRVGVGVPAFASGLLLAASVLACAGILTPLAAAAAFVCASCHGATGVPAAISMLQSAALAIAGPGAYSLDACLFGHRQVFEAKDGDETPPS